MAEKKRSILASASLVIVVMLASKLLGFVRQMVIAGAFGAGVETDLYFVSSDFMLNLSGALLSALTTALIARYVEIAVRESRSAANAVASQMLSLFLLMGAVCILLINLFAPQAAHLLAPAYTGAEAEQLVRYLRFFSVAFVFTAFQSIYASVLNANERFIPGKLYGLVYNPIAIACVLLLAPRFGIRALLWAYLAGNVLQTLLLRRCNRGVFAFRPALDLHDENVRYLVRLSVPLLLSNVFLQLNSIVDKALCSYLGEGIASNYQYAYTLEQFVTSTITATLSLILLSRYSEYVAKDDTASLLRTFRRTGGVPYPHRAAHGRICLRPRKHRVPARRVRRGGGGADRPRAYRLCCGLPARRHARDVYSPPPRLSGHAPPHAGERCRGGAQRGAERCARAAHRHSRHRAGDQPERAADHRAARPLDEAVSSAVPLCAAAPNALADGAGRRRGAVCGARRARRGRGGNADRGVAARAFPARIRLRGGGLPRCAARGALSGAYGGACRAARSA